LKKALDRLVGLVALLRSPKGCPWDRKQTHRSLIKYLNEEAKELSHALRRGRWHEIEDELGDVLLQVLLHAQIASEENRFDIQDVARSQYLKLKRRHPHVFAGRKFNLKTAEDVRRTWGIIKKEERALRRRDVAKRKKARPIGLI
jgi:uncharacterized protein YabN with tetrapyrrole methylase and pyrophosphatase domain